MGEENKEGKKPFLERLKELIAGETETSVDAPVTPPAAAPASPVAAAAGCKCNEHKEGPVGAASAKGGAVHKNAERITALIANPKTPWSEHDRVHLEAKTDEQLTALESFGKEAPAPPAKAEPKIEDLPSAWQAAIRGAEEAEKQNRTALVDRLAAAQQGFTKDELSAMDYAQLTKLGKAVLKDADAKVIDFSAAAGAPRAAASGESIYADDPPDLGAMFRAGAKK